MSDLQIPQERGFPADHLDARREHLLREARRDGRAAVKGWPRALVRPGPRVRILAPVAAVIIAAGAVVGVVTHGRSGKGGSHASAAVHVAVTPVGPGQSAARSTLISVNVPLAKDRRRERPIEIAGADPGQERLLREILARMPTTSVVRIAVAAKVYRGEAGVGLDFTSTTGDPLRADWEEMLVAGAFRDGSARNGLTRVVGLPPASPITGDASPAAAERLVADLRQAASVSGATVDELSVYRPEALAPVVVLRVGDPAAFLERRLPGVLAVLGDRWRDYDGTFVEVVDADGRFVWAAGTNPRVSHGSVGVRPDLAGCSPVLNHGTTPPPCPVGG